MLVEELAIASRRAGRRGGRKGDRVPLAAVAADDGVVHAGLVGERTVAASAVERIALHHPAEEITRRVGSHIGASSRFASGYSAQMLRRFSSLLVAAPLLLGCAGMRIRDASDRVKVVEDVAYIPNDDDPKHRLDLYLPRDPGPHPVVLFVHGGFWRNQDRRYYQAFTGLYGNVGVALAKHGIAVAIPSYRLSPGVGIQDQIADVLASLRWVEENIAQSGGDPTRIVLAGYSAGGHLVTLLTMEPIHMERAGLDPSRIKGCVSLSGILDVHAMELGQDHAFNEEVTYRLFGRSVNDQGRLSPSAYLRADAPPLLAFAAEHDYPFVLSAGENAAARLGALGAKATFRVIPKIDHADMVLSINSKDDHVSDAVAEFVHTVTVTAP